MAPAQPTSLSMAAETSPVNAPWVSAHTSWAPRLMREPASARETSARYTKGGHTQTSADEFGSLCTMDSTSAAFSAREPCIFQLPAMIWRRICEAVEAVSAAQKRGAMIAAGPSGRNATYHGGDFLGTSQGIGLVPGLHHDADDRFGPGGAKHHATVAAQP